MTRPLRWLICLGLFALLGAIGLYTPLMNSSLVQTEDDLEASATQALRVNALDTWAHVNVRGQTAFLTGEAPDADTRSKAIVAVSQATNEAGPVIGGIAHVDVTGLTLAASPLLQKPYRFQADFQGQFVKFDFHVPTIEFQNRLDDIANRYFSDITKVYNKTSLAMGMPDDGWPQAILAGLSALSALDSGFLFAEDRNFKLQGTSTSKSETDIRNRLKSLPSGFTIDADLMLQDRPVAFTLQGVSAAVNDAGALSFTAPVVSTIIPSAEGIDDVGNPNADTDSGNTTKLHDIPLDEIQPEIVNQPTEQTPMTTDDRIEKTKATDRIPSELSIPSPSDIAIPVANNLPPAPVPTEPFSKDSLIIENSPLEISPPRQREAATPPDAPSPKQVLVPVTIPAQTTLDYISPPTRRESAKDAKSRQCQNEITMMLKYSAIQFFPGSVMFTQDTRALLAAIHDTLVRCPTQKITIAGHTDNTGNADENLILSRERAEAVAQYFIAHGIAANRLSATGYGATRPIADNSTTIGQQKNRRVEILVSERSNQ